MTPLEAALQAADLYTATLSDDRTDIMLARIRGLLLGYDHRWSGSGWVPIGIERYYASDLWNPQSGRRSRTYKVAGIIDLLAETTGGLAVIDHKTTSDDIADPNSDYWRQLTVEGQLSHYISLLWLNGIKPAFGIWDVTRKPGTSPRQITKAEQKELLAKHEWFGYRMPEGEVERALTTGRETAMLYEARLANDCIAVRPEHYFQRRTIPRLDAEILEYSTELWDHGQDMLQVRNSGRSVRNSGACMLYGGACKFLGICSGHDSEDSSNWRKKEFVHNEIPPIEGDGRGVLTNSRIRTFQTCRRKHYLQYELGIERIDEEERHALLFGRIWHKALEAYFKTIKEQNGNSNIAEPAIEVGYGNAASEEILAG